LLNFARSLLVTTQLDKNSAQQFLLPATLSMQQEQALVKELLVL